ncbi:unnamed protein product, partial [Mesorhabditis spiculigera]
MLCLVAAFEIQAQVVIPVLRSIADEGGHGITDKSGYYVSTILYLTYTFMNFLVPPVIAKIGPKWAMVAGMLCYVTYMLGFLHVEGWLLYSLSALLGLGAALLWTSCGVNLVRISEEKNVARNSAILWTTVQFSLIVGAAFLIIVLRSEELSKSYRVIYMACAVLGLVGAGIIALMPTPQLRRGSSSSDGSADSNISVLNAFEDTFRLLKTKEMMLLCVVFFFNGFQTVFFGAMYTASLAATTRMDSHEIAIAYAMLAIGAGEFCAGTFFGISGNSRGSQFGRKRVAVIGTCLLLVANVLSIINLPPDAPLHETDNIGFIEPSLWIALFVAFLLGLADCCWQTQTYTILGGMYKDEQSPPAFALFRCFQALSTSIGCFIAPQFELYWTLLMTSSL